MKALELSPEDFGCLAVTVVELCAEYLYTLDERSTFPRTKDAESERLLFDLDLRERGVGDQAFAALADVIGNARAQNGRFFKYVQGSRSHCRPGQPFGVLSTVTKPSVGEAQTT